MESTDLLKLRGSGPDKELISMNIVKVVIAVLAAVATLFTGIILAFSNINAGFIYIYYL